MHRHERPGRDEHGHRHRQRLHGLDPDGGASPRRSRRPSSARTRSRRPTSPASRIPITKHNYLVKDPAELPEVIKEAFHIATTGRPGPVLVDIPVDVSKGELSYHYPETVNLPGYKPTYKGHAKQIKQAAQLIAKARKPLLYAGGGVLASGGGRSSRSSPSSCSCPSSTTLMGKGAFPEDHHLYLGMPGMHGAQVHELRDHRDRPAHRGRRALRRPRDRQARDVRDEGQGHPHRHRPGRDRQEQAGRRADRRRREATCWPRSSPSCARWAPSRAPRRGCASSTTGASATRSTTTRQRRARHAAVRRRARARAHEGPADRGRAPRSARTRCGRASTCGSREPRTWVSSGGLGTMGFGLPAAIGAQAGGPDALVIDIAGDGSIQMNSQEMATASHREAAGEGRHPQQRLPRHGPAVAGAVLRPPLRLLGACRTARTS